MGPFPGRSPSGEGERSRAQLLLPSSWHLMVLSGEDLTGMIGFK